MTYININKSYIYSIFLLLFFSGCSVKIYQTPAIELTVKDAKTKQVIKNAKLEGGVKILYTDINGKISYTGVYETRWHIYPFPIISSGSLYEITYTLSHPEYNDYTLNCKFTSLYGSCGFEILKSTDNKKDMIIN